MPNQLLDVGDVAGSRGQAGREDIEASCKAREAKKTFLERLHQPRKLGSERRECGGKLGSSPGDADHRVMTLILKWRRKERRADSVW